MFPSKLYALLLCLLASASQSVHAEISTLSLDINKNIQVGTATIHGRNLDDNINNTHLLSVAYAPRIKATNKVAINGKVGMAQRYDLFIEKGTSLLSMAKHALLGLHTNIEVSPHTVLEVSWDRYTHLRQDMGRKQESIDVVNVGLSVSTL